MRPALRCLYGPAPYAMLSKLFETILFTGMRIDSPQYEEVEYHQGVNEHEGYYGNVSQTL
jgi:hypothetical protein